MEIKITKERILDAASKCSTAKATLKTLFPEVFEEEDKYAMTVTDNTNSALKSLCLSIGLDPLTIQPLAHATEKQEEFGRGFYLRDEYDWVLKDVPGGSGKILIPYKKPSLL